MAARVGAQQIDEDDRLPGGDPLHDLGVAPELTVAALDIDVAQVREMLVGNWRDQHQPGCALPVVARRQMPRNVAIEVPLERRKPGFAVERLVQAEERQNDVGFLLGEVAGGVAEVERPRLQPDRVAAPAEIADAQLMGGEARHQQRFEMIEVLHPLGQRIPDEHDAVVRAQFQRRRRRLHASGRRREQERTRDEPEGPRRATGTGHGGHGGIVA